MMKNKIKSFLLLVCCLLLFPNNLISQEHEEVPLEELEGQSEQKYNKELQQNFVVVENVANHNFNPHTTALSSDNEILGNLYEGLFSTSPITLEPQYAIAKSYKVSRDKKRWIIQLRKDAYFSNGDNIKAEDVRKSWLKLLATPSAPYASLLDIIRGAKEFRQGKGALEDVGIYVTDEYTISIYLNAPANYLSRVLCHTAFSIVHDLPTVYSGAYLIYDKNDTTTVLRKNPYYWDKNNVVIEQVTFLQSNDDDYNTYLFNTGKAHWLSGNGNSKLILDPTAVQVNPQFGISFYFFKMSKNKPNGNKETSLWDYKEFRNAIIEAMPWDEMRSDYLVPATTFVYPLPGYPTVDGFDFTDPIEAKIKMEAAREKYNIPVDKKIPLVIEIMKDSVSEKFIAAVTNALAPIGVEVSFKEIPAYLYFDNVATSDSDMFTYSWIGDFADPLTFLELFNGEGTLNESGWQNSEFDRLLKEAALGSTEERYKLLAKAENILLDEAIVLPIMYSVSYNIIDTKEVGGWIPNAFDTHLFKYIYLKQEKNDYPNVVMK